MPFHTAAVAVQNVLYGSLLAWCPVGTHTRIDHQANRHLKLEMADWSPNSSHTACLYCLPLRWGNHVPNLNIK